MRIGMLALVVIVLSGCALTKKLPAPCGVTDYIEMPKGTVVTNVGLPTDEAGKKYNVITPKDGFWISLDCDNRIGR
jgi:hypothetical protein